MKSRGLGVSKLKTTTVNTVKPKKITRRLVSIRSRHPSVEPIRGSMYMNEKAVYRHGSISAHPSPYEVNSVESVKTSASKLLMKKAFDAGGVKHLPWMQLREAKIEKDKITNGKVTLSFPVVVKSYYGSRGNGNYKIDTPEALKKFMENNSVGNYIVEQFFNGVMEFRVHITANGPIYSLRKMLKDDVPAEKRWVRNDSTCSWITEFTQNKSANGTFISFTAQDSPKFDKPGNWNEIVEECKKALKAIGGDLLAVDIKAQSNKDSKGNRRKAVEFYILEVNSAPSIGNITGIIYSKEIPKILEYKYANLRTR